MKDHSMMIIDDSEADRYLLKRMLRKVDATCEVFESENGQSGLAFLMSWAENPEQCLRCSPPVLIFLDINMPIMGGFEFLEEFTKLKQASVAYDSVTLVMFSSSDRDEDVKKAQMYDFVKAYMVKGTISLESLRGVVSEFCQ